MGERPFSGYTRRPPGSDATGMSAAVIRRVTTFATSLAFVAGSLGGVPATGVPAASSASVPVSVVSLAAPPKAVPAVVGSASRSWYERRVLRLTNKARQHSRKCGSVWMNKAGRLRWSTTLSVTANRHSADMATRDYFSHYTPSGVSPFTRMRAAGYNYRAAGENIAAGRSLAMPRAVVQAWLRSPGHCQVIMNPKYRELGVGRVEGPGRWHVYWTQNFGSRL
jgi:uncharacterized protein YkwD